MIFTVAVLGFLPGSLHAQGSSSPTPQTKNPFMVNNAINYWQYQQTTGMGPSIGWVRIITQFPANGSQSGFGGTMSNSGFNGSNTGSSTTGSQQPNNGGSDPPSGVFLHSNYGTLVGLPLQQQSSGNGASPFGFGGNPFGYGGGNPYGNGFGLGGGGFNQLNAKGFGNIGGNVGTGL